MRGSCRSGARVLEIGPGRPQPKDVPRLAPAASYSRFRANSGHSTGQRPEAFAALPVLGLLGTNRQTLPRGVVRSAGLEGGWPQPTLDLEGVVV